LFAIRKKIENFRSQSRVRSFIDTRNRLRERQKLLFLTKKNFKRKNILKVIILNNETKELKNCEF